MADKRWGRKSSSESGDAADLLIVESDPEAAAPFVDVFENSDRTNEVHVVSGEEALEFLEKRGEYAAASRPDLVLLEHDDGASDDVLAALAERTPLRRVPVVALLGPDAGDDGVPWDEYHANAYVQKSDDPDALAALARAIEDFWLGAVRLPPKA